MLMDMLKGRRLPGSLRDQFFSTGVALLIVAITSTPLVLRRGGIAVSGWMVVSGWIAALLSGSIMVVLGLRRRTLTARAYTIIRSGQSETWTKERLDQTDPNDRDVMFSSHREFGDWYYRECWAEHERYIRYGRLRLVQWYRRLFPYHRRPPVNLDNERDRVVGLWVGGPCIGVRQSRGILVVFTRMTLSSGLPRECQIRLSLWMQKPNGERTRSKSVTPIPTEVIVRIRQVITEPFQVEELPLKIELGAFDPKRKQSDEFPGSYRSGYAGFLLTEDELRLLGPWHMATSDALTRGAHSIERLR